MAFKIGEVYRYSSKGDNRKPVEYIDNLKNFYYETYSDKCQTTVSFQSGIHNIAKVRLENGVERTPAIIISSSPHKAGTYMTPWEDDFDPDFGHIRYYGDNKSCDISAGNSSGNSLLLEQFSIYGSPNREERYLKGVPLVFFKRVEYDKRKKGNLLFQGYGIIESVELVTQYTPKLKGQYFSNYLYQMCVFSISNEDESFNWDWINARRDQTVSDAEAYEKAPSSWRKWVEEGSANLYKVRRRISALKVISEIEQQPVRGSREEVLLKEIYQYYQDKRHVFELLALRVTQEVFEESGMAFYPGWITSRSGDKGIDFVARLDISNQMSALKIVILGQAKCEAIDRPTGGVHIARTVARLKRGWFGVYVTTSYFSRNLQLEVMDDQYPVMLICGKKLSETVSKILFRKGIDLKRFLQTLDDDYHTENRRTEDILSY